jgi:hypothetical protein
MYEFHSFSYMLVPQDAIIATTLLTLSIDIVDISAIAFSF